MIVCTTKIEICFNTLQFLTTAKQIGLDWNDKDNILTGNASFEGESKSISHVYTKDFIQGA